MMRRKASILVCLLTLVVGPSHPTRAAPPKSYYSPVEKAALVKNRFVKFSQETDHAAITYKLPCDAKDCISTVIESRWEDGSAFSVYAGPKSIFELQEAGPYWGYRQLNGINLFFVDSSPPDPGVEKLKYSELTYNYILLDHSQADSKSYNCVINFHRMKGYISSRLANRQVDASKENPVFLSITKFLSERGADPKLDGCKARR